MTPAEQRSWDEKMSVMNALGIPTQARIELGRSGLDADVIRRVGHEAVRQGVDQAELLKRLRAAVPRESGQDGAEVPGGQPDNAATSGAVTGGVNGAKPATDSSNKRSGAKRRKTQSRTVEKDSESMARVQVKTKRGSDATEEPRLRITREKTVTKSKRSDHDRSAVSPVLINAETAASLCCVSRSQWFVMKRAGRTPAWIMMGRKPVWRIAELLDWINAGCPPKDRWKWRGKPSGLVQA